MKSKYARICWNEKGWKQPSGSAKDGPKTFFGEFGFGFEEWLFDQTAEIDGWRYGFLQPINKGYQKRVGERINLLLYSIPGNNRPRQQEFMINDCEVISPKLASEIVGKFRRSGRLQRMVDQVLAVNGDPAPLNDPSAYAPNLVNMRFRPDQIQRLSHQALPINASRYRLYDAKEKHPSTRNPTLTLRWDDNQSRDYIDILPWGWFESDTPKLGVTHNVRGKDGKVYSAKCDVRVKSRTALLDYTSYPNFNSKNGMLLGTARLTFADDERTQIETAEWKPINSQQFVLHHLIGQEVNLPDAPAYYPPREPAPKKFRKVRDRPGQAKFSRDLKAAYLCCCCVTGCDVVQALEGAHIDPYISEGSNNIRNGLPLRKDIHALFDQHLISIDPDTSIIHVAASVRTKNGYSDLESRELRKPKNSSHCPDNSALKRHWKEFLKQTA